MASDQLLDHEYDGIKEYDNPCPGWWHTIFFATFVFSIGYYLFFHMGNSGWTLKESYDATMAADLKMRFSEIGDLVGDEPTLLTYMNKPDWLAVGKVVFATNCQSCHGADGSGVIGPNLTDNVYKNVEQLTDIVKVIQNGAAGGNMPAWRTRLHPNELVLVAAYVANLRGLNLPSSRGPEGKEIPPWPKAPPAPEKKESVKK